MKGMPEEEEDLFFEPDGSLATVASISLPVQNTNPHHEFVIQTGQGGDVWYLDPQNATGRASDANDGRSRDTPLLTWGGFTALHGSEVIRFGTTINLLSVLWVQAQEPLRFETRLSEGLRGFLVGEPPEEPPPPPPPRDRSQDITAWRRLLED